MSFSVCHLELDHHGGVEAGVELRSGETAAPHLASYGQTRHSNNSKQVLKTPEGLVETSV